MVILFPEQSKNVQWHVFSVLRFILNSNKIKIMNTESCSCHKGNQFLLNYFNKTIVWFSRIDYKVEGINNSLVVNSDW